MARPPGTPKKRGPGRPPLKRTPSGARSEPPLKKRRYVPGGPGGGGRYIDEDGNETPVGGTGPGGYAYTGPRGRVGRMNAELGIVPPTPPTAPPATTNRRTRTPSFTRPAREKQRLDEPKPRYQSAAAAVAASTSGEAYKPREERGWEEFHPDLDINVKFKVFPADEVDGTVPLLPNQLSINPNLFRRASDPASTDASSSLGLPNGTSSTERVIETPSVPPPPPVVIKRRPGRPPRRPESMLTGLGSPPLPRITPSQTVNPKERLNLPKPQYRRVDTFSRFEQDHAVSVNYVDRTLAGVGYQESDLFLRPERTYIRGSEGSLDDELDLAMSIKTDEQGSGTAVGRVEYDMDEQDERWLEDINAHRRTEGVDPIKPAIFEVTMTQIEKEWYALEKRIPKPNPKPPQTQRPRSSSAAAVNGEPLVQGEEQDTKCAVCDDGDCENTNAIVFCDGCDLAVHQECYGVPFIPEGQWLCRKCQLIGRGTPNCIFCPNVDGAFKQTNNNKWAHLLCAFWIPEVSLGNTAFMEPVMDVEKVPKQRWKLTCYICEQRMGACIQCGNKNCFKAFHVTCARRAKLFLKMKLPQGGLALDTSILKAFCHLHVPKDWRDEHDVETATADARVHYQQTMKGKRWADSQQTALSTSAPQFYGDGDGDPDEGASPAKKRKRDQAIKAIWRLPSGAPVIPHLVFHNVENTLIRFAIRKRKEFVAEACKYWTLKREARRGASLLKRLQLQLDTFSSMEITRRNFAGMGAVGRPRLQRRIEFAERLEDEMEQIRNLCFQVKERELLKLEDARLMKSIIETVYFPILPLLRPILDKAASQDSKNYFTGGFDKIDQKVRAYEYTSVAPFCTDLLSMFHATITETVECSDKSVATVIVPHHALTADQKERKKHAKRIARALKPMLENALRCETDLSGRSFEKELGQWEAFIISRDRQESFAVSANGNMMPLIAEADQTNAAPPLTNGDMVEDDKDVVMVDSIEHESETKPSLDDAVSTDPVAQAPTPAIDAKDELTDDAAIQKQIAAEGENPHPSHDTVDQLSRSGGSAATLSLGGSTLPSTAHLEPLTPPRSDRESAGFLSQGGVPWYMEAFDPVGTTIHDERRELGRAGSSDLSSILAEEDMVELVAEEEEEEEKEEEKEEGENAGSGESTTGGAGAGQAGSAAGSTATTRAMTKKQKKRRR